MAAKNFKVGDRVRFKGTRGEGGRPLAIHADGADTFYGKVGEEIAGVAYGIRLLDNLPLGCAMHDQSLVPDGKEMDLGGLKEMNPSAFKGLPSKLSRAKFYLMDGMFIIAILEVGGSYVWKGRKWSKR